jgi:hypothetical protein
MPERGKNVGNEGWAFETAERANRDSGGLHVTASRSLAQDGEVV